MCQEREEVHVAQDKTLDSGARANCMRCHQRQRVAEDTPARVRGTLQKMDGNTLTIATKSGKETNVPLKDGAPVIAVTKGAMSDIKDNTFVGITAMPQPDGTQKAVEVHVFEESLRGIGEGHYPWDLKPDSTMTNGAVAQ
jgi:hypothetical protein